MLGCKRYAMPLSLTLLIVLAIGAVGLADGDHTVGHGHESVSWSEDLPVPTVDVSVVRDAKSGWNLHVLTTHFRWAPEFASGPEHPGEGHAHLYIDGQKVARLYGPWYHIESLDTGAHEILVTLNANDHRDYVYQGTPLSDTLVVEVVE